MDEKDDADTETRFDDSGGSPALGALGALGGEGMLEVRGAGEFAGTARDGAASGSGRLPSHPSRPCAISGIADGTPGPGS
jgi:hypothetical protein